MEWIYGVCGVWRGDRSRGAEGVCEGRIGFLDRAWDNNILGWYGMAMGTKFSDSIPLHDRNVNSELLRGGVRIAHRTTKSMQLCHSSHWNPPRLYAAFPQTTNIKWHQQHIISNTSSKCPLQKTMQHTNLSYFHSHRLHQTSTIVYYRVKFWNPHTIISPSPTHHFSHHHFSKKPEAKKARMNDTITHASLFQRAPTAIAEIYIPPTSQIPHRQLLPTCTNLCNFRGSTGFFLGTASSSHSKRCSEMGWCYSRMEFGGGRHLPLLALAIRVPADGRQIEFPANLLTRCSSVKFLRVLFRLPYSCIPYSPSFCFGWRLGFQKPSAGK